MSEPCKKCGYQEGLAYQAMSEKEIGADTELGCMSDGDTIILFRDLNLGTQALIRKGQEHEELTRKGKALCVQNGNLLMENANLKQRAEILEKLIERALEYLPEEELHCNEAREDVADMRRLLAAYRAD